MQPPKGYYRQLLPSNLSNVRLAHSNMPMQGVTQVDPKPTLDALDASDDQHAAYYARGIRNGSILTVVENQGGRIWKPGELFFGS
jgi:hypothetical protein